MYTSSRQGDARPDGALLRAAVRLARARGHRLVEPVHVLAAALDEPAATAPAGRLGAALEALPVHDGRPSEPRVSREALALAGMLTGLLPTAPGPASPAAPSRDPGPPVAVRQEPPVAPGALRDVRAVAPAPAPAHGTRREDLGRLLRLLARRDRPHVALVAEADLEPSTMAGALAHALRADDAPHTVARRPLLSLGDVLAGGAAHAPTRLRAALTSLTGTHTDALLWVDALDRLLEECPAAAGVLRSALAGPSRLLLVAAPGGPGETFAAAEPRVSTLVLAEPGPAETRALLEAEREGYEQHHRVRLSPEAVDAAVALAGRELPGRRRPGAARDLLDEAAAARQPSVGASGPDAAAGQAARGPAPQPAAGASTPGPTVTATDVARVVAARAGVPLASLVVDDRLAHLEQRLGAQVIGQRAAVATVSAALRRAHAGIADPARPVASFLFLGPTGVGKTKLARTLAVELVGDRDALVRLDMGEYQEPHAVARMLGAPPGYVGFGREGALSGPLRRRPHAVVLLDEIEKAHPDVRNVLLAVLEEGRLTDGRGEVVDVRRAVIVMTSNLGAGHILDPSLERGEIVRRVLDETRRTMPPEFLNRVDDLVVFERLDPEALLAITDVELADLAARLGERGLRLRVDGASRAWLAARGHDPAYGARPLRRTIRTHVENPLAAAIVAGTFTHGDEVCVHVDDAAGLRLDRGSS